MGCRDGTVRAAEHFVEALHTEADAKDRHPPVPVADQILGDTSVCRVFGAGADQDVVRGQCFDTVQGDGVAAEHLYFEWILAKHLHQVIGETSRSCR